MKTARTYVLVCMLVTQSIAAFCGAMDVVDQQRTSFLLLDKSKGTIVPVLATLFHVLNIDYDGTIEGAVAQSQKKFLRPAQSERWDIQQHTGDARWKSLCTRLGMVHAKIASQNSYTYGVVLGATLVGVRDRIELLKKEWLRGVRFKEIIVLMGERPLRDVERHELKLSGHADVSSEPAMMRCVYNDAQLPPDLKSIPLTFIEAQAKPNAARATTADTVERWLATHPAPGTILAFSSQPVTFYQDTVLKRLLPVTFSIETIGNEAPEDTPLGVYTDTLARWLFEEYTRYSQEKRSAELKEQTVEQKDIMQ